ncbi:UDP-N-acetylglucosamine 2-epimerase (non-hydrolyzing) [Pedobacter sp. Du54]|uniref:non-hydrolyzing UDP-N-acetylglucosamine 2-epimerase n=1 Tax=Pedobacter anseongensis TaxID=3133439 RepID=UPI00309C3A4B
MNKLTRVVIFYGTRPEVIKVAPIIHELNKHKNIKTIVCHTGQHKELTLELEDIFNIKVDYRLSFVNRGLNYNLAEIIKKSNTLLNKLKPDLVLIQGDTTTVMAVALTSFNLGIKVGHIEAGLRSFNLREPFPEELNRKIATTCSHYHFAPTLTAKENLLKEGVAENSIWVTGNTVIDALTYIKRKFDIAITTQKIILITAHRRENHGQPLLKICNAVSKLSKQYPDFTFIWPLHPNPNVYKIVKEKLVGLTNVSLIEPLGYNKLIELMASCYLIWTDSGGIQEEVPSLMKPVLILRNVTERPEVVTSGFGILCGTDEDILVNKTAELINDSKKREEMIKGSNPFGEGSIAKNIVSIINDQA